MAVSAHDFHRRLEKPRAFAREFGAGLSEYLARALWHRATLTPSLTFFAVIHGNMV